LSHLADAAGHTGRTEIARVLIATAAAIDGQADCGLGLAGLRRTPAPQAPRGRCPGGAHDAAGRPRSPVTAGDSDHADGRPGTEQSEIGQALYLSPRTVGSHLYRIFPKLNITSRMYLGAALSVAADPRQLVHD
jgi:hypothetical protein